MRLITNILSGLARCQRNFAVSKGGKSYTTLRSKPCLLTSARYRLTWSFFSRQLQLQAKVKRKPPRFIPRHGLDKVSKDFQIIYVSSLRHWLSVTRVGLCMLGIGVCGLSIFKASQMSLDSFASLQGLFICGGPIVILVFLLLYHTLTRSVVCRIYHNNSQFIAVRRNVFGQLKKLNYTLRDISLKQEKSVNQSYNSVTLNIKDESVFLLASDFVNSEFYSMHINGEMFAETNFLSKEHFY